MCELANRAIRNPDETNQRRCTGYTAMPQARGTSADSLTPSWSMTRGNATIPVVDRRAE